MFEPKNSPKGDKGKDKENRSLNVKSKDKKQASKKPYQWINHLSPKEMERYHKENQCFWCGEIGHTYYDFTQCQNLKVINVMTTFFDDPQESNQLYFVRGKF